MKKWMRTWLFVAVALIVAACGDTTNEYTIGNCFLVIDNSTHQDATLAGCMNPNAPGTFCIIKTVFRSGANYFEFTDNAGVTSSKIFNAIDSRRSQILGYNNGVIVGYSALNTPATFYAFDLECPNCFDPQALPVRSKPLSLTTNGLAVCAVCHRQYSLNNDGFIASGDQGKKLTRYRATTTGPFGVLSVH